MSDYQVVECPRAECGLRFPGEVAVPCPLCKAPTRHAASPLPSQAPKLATRGRSFGVLVDNVRSVFNVGSIFRTADGAGLSPLYLCGISPTPQHPRMNKTALGAESRVAWSHHRSALSQARALREAGATLWALEESNDDLFDAAIDRPDDLVLVIGNEVLGVDPDVLALCDRRVAIPMFGVKVSLNVATAFGIAAYALRLARE
jgi:tRNA G18 (ribose-2'-O)-methylase SpoU